MEDTLRKKDNKDYGQSIIVDISDLDATWKGFEKRTRYSIEKCKQRVRKSDDLVKLNYFHSLSRPDRKIDYNFIKETYERLSPNCCLLATDTAMAMFGWDSKLLGYYLLAGRDKTMKPDGSPSKILWHAMQELHSLGIKELDLCGANHPNILLFKRGFGGRLVKQKKFCLNY